MSGVQKPSKALLVDDYMELYNLLYIGDYGGFEHHEPMNVSNESIGNPVLNQAVFGRRVWRVSNTQEGGRG